MSRSPDVPVRIQPRRLSDHARIAVVSPSWGGCGELPARYQRAVAALEALGHQVVPMPHAFGVSDGVRGWVSASVADRVDDLHRAFTDPTVDAVLFAIGGNHSAHLLPQLDFDLIAAHPKLLCGYSDATSLLLALWARIGLTTIYGPALLPEFGEIGGPDAEVVDWFLRVVTRPEPAGPLPVVPWQATESRIVTDAEGRPRRREPGEPRRALRPGVATGTLLPGCLPTIRSLIGTPWEPDWQGVVLHIEPPEEPYDVRQADADLTHLRNVGVLDRLAALTVGRTDGFSERERQLLDHCVLDAVAGFDYPVLAGVECAHAAPMLALPVGVGATVAGTDLIIEEAAVRP